MSDWSKCGIFKIGGKIIQAFSSTIGIRCFLIQDFYRILMKDASNSGVDWLYIPTVHRASCSRRQLRLGFNKVFYTSAATTFESTALLNCRSFCFCCRSCWLCVCLINTRGEITLDLLLSLCTITLCNSFPSMLIFPSFSTHFLFFFFHFDLWWSSILRRTDYCISLTLDSQNTSQYNIIRSYF